MQKLLFLRYSFLPISLGAQIKNIPRFLQAYFDLVGFIEAINGLKIDGVSLRGYLLAKVFLVVERFVLMRVLMA